MNSVSVMLERSSTIDLVQEGGNVGSVLQTKRNHQNKINCKQNNEGKKAWTLLGS